MPDRARLPASGEFLHRSVFDVSWLSTVGGGWDRKPTPRGADPRCSTDPKDIPPSLDVRSAEVRVYHMWDESTVGLSAIDTQRHALLFSTPAKSPPGAFGVKKYVIFNTREGLTRPGQWCLDRDRRLDRLLAACGGGHDRRQGGRAAARTDSARRRHEAEAG
ncbi:MAG: hypothetical protein ACOX1P_07840 [Thermoguttaceae bacterium]